MLDVISDCSVTTTSADTSGQIFVAAKVYVYVPAPPKGSGDQTPPASGLLFKESNNSLAVTVSPKHIVNVPLVPGSFASSTLTVTLALTSGQYSVPAIVYV